MPSWTPFCLQNCLNSSWHRFNKEILVHIDMIASHSCCRFVGCTSMMWISRSTTSQSCSIGLRSGDCGGHLSKMQTSTPHHYTTTTSLNHWDKAGWIHAFMFFYAKFWPYHLNIAAEIETHQTRQRFSNLLLSNFGDPVWIVSSVSCS